MHIYIPANFSTNNPHEKYINRVCLAVLFNFGFVNSFGAAAATTVTRERSHLGFRRVFFFCCALLLLL